MAVAWRSRARSKVRFDGVIVCGIYVDEFAERAINLEFTKALLEAHCQNGVNYCIIPSLEAQEIVQCLASWAAAVEFFLMRARPTMMLVPF